MKGKIGLVVGLGVGYVLGTRAGRERYDQIKKQWLKVWERDAVQDQVDKVKEFVGDKAAAVPGAVWNGAVKLVKSVNGSGTPGQKLDSAIATGRAAAADLADATEEAVEEAKRRAEGDGAKTERGDDDGAQPAAKSPGAKSSAAKKTGA